MKPSLAKTNRALSREWHPTKNAPLTPSDVIAGSNKKAWWQCEKGHEWQAAISHRNNRGTKCPYCTGKKASKENCLETVQPELARQWHPARNATLTPKDVTAGCGKKVWWQCEKGHEWQAAIAKRNYGGGCARCSGSRPIKENSIEVKGPWLAREWHPTKNGSWTPKEVSPFSKRQVVLIT